MGAGDPRSKEPKRGKVGQNNRHPSIRNSAQQSFPLVQEAEASENAAFRPQKESVLFAHEGC